MRITKLNFVYNKDAASASISDKNRITQSQKANPGNAIVPEKTEQKPNGFVKNDLMLNRLNLLKSDLKGVAKNIHSSDNNMEAVEKYVDNMKNQLGKIVKNYPPFPQESQERIAILRNYSSIRKIIDKLTFPPREDFIPETITWENTLQEKFSEKNRPNIPELASTNTDSEITASLEKLEIVKEALKQNRNDLKNKADSLNFSAIYHKINGKLIKPLNTHEIDPEQLSVELRHEISNQAGGSLGTDPSTLQDLL
jgi:archaellum component FlaC